ncbi:MAG TPA: cytochrome b5 domain-containing protein [Candidatus Izemoplasmatales bacterium]|nr:cytochrome b5 domain-containing protein [Candidatus Izemoplasmatales bacterium]
MKSKILSIMTLIILSFALAACDGQTSTTSPISSTTPAVTATSTTTSTSTTTTSTSTTTTSTSTTQSVTLRSFTLAELAVFDGHSGTTAYIAVNGIVYDVTDVAEWTNGWHKGMHLAGTDATAAFADSSHSSAFLGQLEIVGTLLD